MDKKRKINNIKGLRAPHDYIRLRHWKSNHVRKILYSLRGDKTMSMHTANNMSANFTTIPQWLLKLYGLWITVWL